MGKILVVYYSLVNGNTKRVADLIAERKSADTLRLRTKEPYPQEDAALKKKAQEESEQGKLPALQDADFDFDSYDTFYIGTPVWGCSMSSPVKSFLAAHDFTGKKVIPFATHSGKPGDVLSDIKKECKGADFGPGFLIQFDSNEGPIMMTLYAEIFKWIKRSTQDGAEEEMEGPVNRINNRWNNLI